MSTIAAFNSQPVPSASLHEGASLHRFLFTLTVLTVAMAFFVSEHNVNISRAQDYTQNAEEMIETAGGGNWGRRLAFLAVGGLGMLLLVIAPAHQKLAMRWPLALAIASYLGWCFLSYFWAANSGMCLRRLFVFGCCIVAAAGIARTFTMREISQMVLIITIGSSALGILSELRLGTFRPWDGEYRFAGSVHPNTQGMYLAALCLSAFGLARATKKHLWFYWGLVGFGLFMILLTKSRTSALAVVVSIGVVLTLQTSLQFKVATGVVAGWLGMSAFWTLLLQGINPIVDFQEALFLGRQEGAETFSGRFFIWPEVTYFISKRFWTGYGFESFWTVDHIETISEACGWGLREAHNAYLEIALGMGMIGLTMLLSAVLLAFWSAATCYLRDRDTTYAFPLGMIVFGLINSGLESGMVGVFAITFMLGCCFFRISLYGAASQPLAQSNSLASSPKTSSSIPMHHQVGKRMYVPTYVDEAT